MQPNEIARTQPPPKTHVIVTDVQMPFKSMVRFMVKWVLASIPAAIILMVVAFVVGVLLSMIAFSWMPFLGGGKSKAEPRSSIDTPASEEQTPTTEASSSPVLQISSSEEDVRAHCSEKWAEDFDMQEYCIEKGLAAKLRVIDLGVSEQGIPSGTVKKIIGDCVKKWDNDWEMIEFCATKQIAAAQSLR